MLLLRYAFSSRHNATLSVASTQPRRITVTLKPGLKTRGSSTGRPIMVLFDALGRRWTLRILWELRDQPLRFRELQKACGSVSPTVLNTRLKMLRGLQLVDLESAGYTLTDRGHQLSKKLAGLHVWADEWAAELEGSQES